MDSMKKAMERIRDTPMAFTASRGDALYKERKPLGSTE
jgi:hypothetical protein